MHPRILSPRPITLALVITSALALAGCAGNRKLDDLDARFDRIEETMAQQEKPLDHAELADFFDAEAEEMRDLAEHHRKLVDKYDKGARYGKQKYWLESRSRRLAKRAENAAEEAAALADAHRKLAGDTSDRVPTSKKREHPEWKRAEDRALAARTKTDHLEIAALYEEEARELLLDARHHEKMAEIYSRSHAYDRVRGLKEEMVDHLRRMAKDFREESEDLRELADRHRELARSAEN